MRRVSRQATQSSSGDAIIQVKYVRRVKSCTLHVGSRVASNLPVAWSSYLWNAIRACIDDAIMSVEPAGNSARNVR